MESPHSKLVKKRKANDDLKASNAEATLPPNIIINVCMVAFEWVGYSFSVLRYPVHLQTTDST